MAQHFSDFHEPFWRIDISASNGVVQIALLQQE